MAKRSYKTVPISRLNIERLREQVGSRCIFGVDIAKTRQVGAFSGIDGRAVVRVHWNHPSETRELLDTLERMQVTGIHVEVRNDNLHWPHRDDEIWPHLGRCLVAAELRPFWQLPADRFLASIAGLWPQSRAATDPVAVPAAPWAAP